MKTYLQYINEGYYIKTIPPKELKYLLSNLFEFDIKFETENHLYPIYVFDNNSKRIEIKYSDGLPYKGFRVSIYEKRIDLNSTYFVEKEYKAFDPIKELIFKSVVDNINRLYPIIEKILYVMDINKTYSDSKMFLCKLRSHILPTKEYQECLYNNGEIEKLLKLRTYQNINRLIPEIEDKLKDIKKQEDWS